MTNKRVLLIITVIIIFSIIIPGIFILRGKQEVILPDDKNDSSEAPQTQLKEVNFTLYNGEKTVRWELTAFQMLHDNNNHLRLNPVEVSVYNNDDNKRLYKFTAEKGNYTGDENKLKIFGPVIIELHNYRIRMGSLTWFQQEDTIRGSSGIKITTPDKGIVTGTTLITDSCLNNINIYGSDTKQAYYGWKEKGHEEN